MSKKEGWWGEGNIPECWTRFFNLFTIFFSLRKGIILINYILFIFLKFSTCFQVIIICVEDVSFHY
jgi:hypothetical protein